jgi:hypothetical protein
MAAMLACLGLEVETLKERGIKDPTQRLGKYIRVVVGIWPYCVTAHVLDVDVSVERDD